MKWLRTLIARRRLQKLVTARRNSFEVVAYRKHRAAALLGLLRMPVV